MLTSARLVKKINEIIDELNKSQFLKFQCIECAIPKIKVSSLDFLTSALVSISLYYNYSYQ